MLLEAAIVAQILGTRMPPSTVTVPKVTNKPSANSVYFYDNLINLTNRVLDRSIRSDVVRVHTNMQTDEVAVRSAKRNQQAVEAHCQLRLKADNIQNFAQECGAGLLSR